MSSSFPTERSFTLMLEHLRSIAKRKERFSYDVRGNSYVTRDLVAAYSVANGHDGLPELENVLRHALDHDSIVSGYRDPADGRMHYSSCRIFTDALNATTFARAHGQPTVYNWNRWAVVETGWVPSEPVPAKP
ncbi:MAG: hypothetical protein ABI432_10075 [Flavobacteriales bacterium]